MRVAQTIELTERENETLTRWAGGRRTAVRVMKRAKIVLLAAKGEQNKTIAERLGMDRGQVSRWRRRFVEKRVAGIEKDLARGGRKATQREQMAPVIIERTTQTKPPHATHWSVRMLADTLGIDKSMVQRVWHASGLKPHLAKTFKGALAVARRIRTGTLAINGAMWFAVDTPFGGYRQSGIGRENGIAGFEEYLETKVMSLPPG